MQSWTVKELLEWTSNYFKEKNIKEARLEAEILLARVLGKDRVYLYANYDAPVNQDERSIFREFIKRRARKEPLAYITGAKEFMSLEFKVNPNVLIPRPESEIIVEKAIDLFKDQPCTICDIGTGSGALAISLAYYLPLTQVFATDISPQALATARENADSLEVEVEFLEGDLLSPFLDKEQCFDLIVANLPYISQEEYHTLDSGVKSYEPQIALLAPGDGLDIYRRLLPQAFTLLKEGAYLFIEIGWQQGEKAIQMMSDFEEIQLIKDLAGYDRVVMARKGSVR
ncbi:MAG: peptide chain release factor N(5)-glutamine methyltransferase [Syntrophomonadaceae bacterium]|nr:peptide chain release factor N(5)-glutamine methyltransferase [Syntrophomonadaceae bacterium]